MNTAPEPRRRPVWALGFVILLVVAAGDLSGCGEQSSIRQRLKRPAVGIKAAKKPMPPPEIIVKLREQDKRLETVVANGDTTLLYGGAPLTIFDGLPEAGNLRIRQSFPEFSRRWQREHAWRSGQNDSAAADVAMIIRLANACDREENIQELVDAWQGDRDSLAAHPGGVEAVLGLLRGTSQSATGPGAVGKSAQPVGNDAAQAAEFVRSIRSDEKVFGDRDSLAIPGLLSLLECSDITRADSVAVYRFAHRLRKEGGDAGVADVALKAVDRLVQSQPIGLRDSQAIASWVRLLGGDDVPTTPRSNPAVDLFLRVQIASPDVNTNQLLRRLNKIDEVESAVRAFPQGPSTSAPSVNVTVQVTAAAACYQDPDTIGIDAAAAWELPGGRGQNARLILCDASFQAHSDLPAVNPVAGTTVNGQINVIREPWGASSNDAIHGTQTLGLLLAKHDGDDSAGSPNACPTADGAYAANLAVNGMCDSVKEVYFSSVLPNQADLAASEDGITSTLDGITSWLKGFSTGGDVLIIEAQLATDSSTKCSEGDCPDMLPVEANSDNFAFIRTLTSEYGVTIIEAAGNGRGELSPVSDQSQSKIQWNPAVDSGAIMVGAGMPFCYLTPRTRMTESNYGDRVDCQAWGLCVQSTTFNPFTKAEAFGEFTHTSSATAIIGGLVTCFQSAYFGAYSGFLSPEALRAALRDEEYGTPQAAEAAEGGEAAETGRIGPLPNLRKLLIEYGILPPVV